ncbi:MAG: hypothetical protein AAF602_10225, partial [Myxococcota bacterium]
MASLWAEHDATARELLNAHGGREIDKSDGFLLLFDEPSAARAYAAAYHRALEPLGWTARVGLHVGPVILRENRPEHVARGAKPLEVEGVAKVVAARIMALARGGQTLASDAARGEEATSHGHWRFKGLLDPIEVFGTGDPAPPPDGPKAWRVVRQGGVWLPARTIHHTLPAERDAFVGRTEDLRFLGEALDDGSRLVSLVGAGGAGKTRLVTRFGWLWLGDYPGGIWFCDLTEARSLDGLAHATARGLEIDLDVHDPIDTLGHAIRGRRRCLVVLDNLEQVAEHATSCIGRWLDQAPEAQFVVTSREVLGLAGETTLAVAPLPLGEAVDLFVARARQARRDFDVEDSGVLDELAAKLDGLPLALELAAARVRVMGPRTLLERLDQRFRLLAAPSGRPERQSTLRATLDWSWDLLSRDEQDALAQLSTFEEGFTLEAAEAVVDLSSMWPVDAVQALVDKSLVRRTGERRFTLLVSVQAYAMEKLHEAGARKGAEVRHGRFFERLGSPEALEALSVATGPEPRRELEEDLENLVAACRRAVARSDGPVAASTMAAAWAVLDRRGPVALGASLADEALSITLSDVDRARVLRHRGLARWALAQRREAHEDFVQARDLSRASGRRADEAHLLANLGALHHARGQYETAWTLAHEALTIFREVGDPHGEGRSHSNLGLLARSL